MKRRSRSTKGLNAQVFVAKAINITTDGTIADFVANAPIGEIGVFDGSDVLHADAINASEYFYIAMKMTDGIKRSILLKRGNTEPYKKAYVAPVKQVSHVGWTGSGGSLNLDTLVAGENYLLRIIETTEAYDPYPTWAYEVTTKFGDTQMEIVQKLAKKMNDDKAPEHKQNNRLITVKVKADATYGNYALTGTTPTMTVTNGSEIVQIESGDNDGAHDVAVGDYISFDAAATPTDSVGDVYKVIAVTGSTDGTFTLNRPYQGATQTFTEAQAEGTRVKKVTAVEEVGLEITSLENNAHFKIAVSEELVNADITYTTPYTQGNGTYEMVRDMEKEGETWEGDTTKNVAFAADYGQQDIFSVDGETYDTYHIPYKKSVAGIGAEAEHSHLGHIIIAVAKSTGNVDSTLDTLLGL